MPCEEKEAQRATATAMLTCVSASRTRCSASSRIWNRTASASNVPVWTAVPARGRLWKPSRNTLNTSTSVRTTARRCMTACWLCVDGSARKSGGIEYGLNSILTEKWEGKAYRLVIQRQRRVDGNLDLWEGEYTYRCILTNDYTSTNREVVEFYNLRGGKERIFDDMNNGFGWARLPKSFMAENTVFLLLTALIRNFYKFLMDRIDAKAFGLKKTAPQRKPFTSYLICIVTSIFLLLALYFLIRTRFRL